jgi:hypothetical protein
MVETNKVPVIFVAVLWLFGAVFIVLLWAATLGVVALEKNQTKWLKWTDGLFDGGIKTY